MVVICLHGANALSSPSDSLDPFTRHLAGESGVTRGQETVKLELFLNKNDYKRKCEFLRAHIYNRLKSVPSAFVISSDFPTTIL